MTSWADCKPSFRASPALVDLAVEERKAFDRRTGKPRTAERILGEVGMADFPAGEYPACSLHGAMLRMSPGRIYRCISCGIGCEVVEPSSSR